LIDNEGGIANDLFDSQALSESCKYVTTPFRDLLMDNCDYAKKLIIDYCQQTKFGTTPKNAFIIRIKNVFHIPYSEQFEMNPLHGPPRVSTPLLLRKA
jgi:hypothetical protein